jgi:hypothetical protein
MRHSVPLEPPEDRGCYQCLYSSNPHKPGECPAERCLIRKESAKPLWLCEDFPDGIYWEDEEGNLYKLRRD